MERLYDCSVDTDLLTGMRLAKIAIQRAELVVVPTDTVYGLAADAFNAKGVAALLAAKGRDRQSPPPVLIGKATTMSALAEHVEQQRPRRPGRRREIVQRIRRRLPPLRLPPRPPKSPCRSDTSRRSPARRHTSARTTKMARAWPLKS